MKLKMVLDNQIELIRIGNLTQGSDEQRVQSPGQIDSLNHSVLYVMLVQGERVHLSLETDGVSEEGSLDIRYQGFGSLSWKAISMFDCPRHSRGVIKTLRDFVLMLDYAGVAEFLVAKDFKGCRYWT